MWLGILLCGGVWIIGSTLNYAACLGAFLEVEDKRLIKFNNSEFTIPNYWKNNYSLSRLYYYFLIIIILPYKYFCFILASNKRCLPYKYCTRIFDSSGIFWWCDDVKFKLKITFEKPWQCTYPWFEHFERPSVNEDCRIEC